MTKTIVVGGIAVAVIGVLAYIVWPQLASAPQTDDAANGEGSAVMPDYYDVLVSVTEEGFSPSTVTIKKGQSIRWTNSATSDFETWPASAVHPTHSAYPETTGNDCLGSAFDACRALMPGGSWQFIFNEVGEWRFHDHMHPSKTGVVVVTE